MAPTRSRRARGTPAPARRRVGVVTWQAYLYAHLAVFAGITATGVGVLKVVLASPDLSVADGARWALCGGRAAFLIALAAMHLTSVGHVTRPRSDRASQSA